MGIYDSGRDASRDFGNPLRAFSTKFPRVRRLVSSCLEGDSLLLGLVTGKNCSSTSYCFTVKYNFFMEIYFATSWMPIMEVELM